MLTKIISGGQTGADRSGLIVAKAFGLKTGGWMPKGFLAQDGLKPEFAELYNIVEHSSPLYPPRTRLNVRDSDATVRFATNWESSGERLTLKEIKLAKKPHFDVNILGSTSPQELADWIIENKVETLNVAGNSERTSPEIGEFVVAFLSQTLELLNLSPQT